MSQYTSNAQRQFTENLNFIGPNPTRTIQTLLDWNLNSGLRAVAKALESESIFHIADAHRCFQENQNAIGVRTPMAKTVPGILGWNLNAGLHNIATSVSQLISEKRDLEHEVHRLKFEVENLRRSVK
jgi:hypothetical protein